MKYLASYIQKRKGKMVDDKYTDLIAKYLSGNIVTRDKRELMAWVKGDPANRMFFDSMLEVWNEAGDYEEEITVDTDKAWTNLEAILDKQDSGAAIEVPGKVKVVSISRYNKWLRVAAAGLLLCVAGYWWTSVSETVSADTLVQHQTGNQERMEHVLPDGSTIWLNQNTSIAYEKGFEPRTIQLEGEAFFDVVRDPENPFVIIAGAAETRVLGTSFNVRAYPDEEQVEVTVETGKVELKGGDAETKEIQLSAGKSGIYEKSSEKLVISEETLANAQAWKKRSLQFEETKMTDVILSLERYFDIDIEVENEAFLDCPLTTTAPFDDPNVETVFEILEFYFDAQVERDGSKYIIVNGSCN